MSIVFLSSYNNLLNFAQIFSQISSGLEQIKKLMDIPKQKSGKLELSATQQHTIQFENVSFAYEKKEVLKNINLTIPNGSFTALSVHLVQEKQQLHNLSHVFGIFPKGTSE